MRPVHLPPWRPDWEGRPLTAVLLQALGRFCSACERRLPQEAFAWDLGRWDEALGTAAAERWQSVLVLCRNCAEAAAAAPPGTRARLARPDRDLTFRLSRDTPLSYALATLRVVRRGRTGPEAAAPEPVERVLAVPATPEASATVDAFALNTLAHRASDLLELREEDSGLDDAEFDDPRLPLRTTAWRSAHRIAEALRRAESPDDRRTVESYLVMTAEDQGFWSVWATVLWSELRDAALLRRTLLPRPPAPGLLGAPPSAPAAFPATRAEALIADDEDA